RCLLSLSPRSVHHRALHSFPTRRSSDLDVEEQERERGAVALDRGHGPALPFAVRAGPRRDFDLRGREALEPRVDALVGAARHGRDRKSTRLNSSHVKISYAVFCLKKKNK